MRLPFCLRRDLDAMTQERDLLLIRLSAKDTEIARARTLEARQRGIAQTMSRYAERCTLRLFRQARQIARLEAENADLRAKLAPFNRQRGEKGRRVGGKERVA
jgi:hypothetical protein